LEVTRTDGKASNDEALLLADELEEAAPATAAISARALLEEESVGGASKVFALPLFEVIDAVVRFECLLSPEPFRLSLRLHDTSASGGGMS
jgi:hypothetical protein